MKQLQADVKQFLNNVEQSTKKAPAWFDGFKKHLIKFTGDVEKAVGELESSLNVQKSVTDALAENKSKLEVRIKQLELDLEESQQYSRRTNVLIHGIEEEDKEDTDRKAHELFTGQLGLDLVEKDIARSHRLGKRSEGRNRPIIVRLLSYRQKKSVYDQKKKLKGSGVVITENLTKERYTFYKKCKEKFGAKNVATLDGRIYRYTDTILPNGRNERKMIPFGSEI